MATKNVAPQKTKAPEVVKASDAKLAKIGKQDLALAERPDWIEAGDTAGTELSLDDIRLPRLAIAQGLSPQLIESDPSYIENLKMLDLFNDLTGEIYGKGPVEFVPIRYETKRIQFKPRSEGGGVLDMNVPVDDPRAQWSDDGSGNRIPPLATTFKEWIVLLLQDGKAPEPIVISIKQTNRWNTKAATNLSMFITLPHPIFGRLPIYGQKYTLSVVSEKNDKGTFGVPVVKKAGVLKDGEIGLFAKGFRESLVGKTIVIDRNGDDESGEGDN